MVKGVGVSTMSKAVSHTWMANAPICILSSLRSLTWRNVLDLIELSVRFEQHLINTCYWSRFANSGLLAESLHRRKPQTQRAIESEFLPRTPSLLDPSSGTKWNVKTRSESVKVRSCRSARSSSARRTQLRTTESYSSIWLEPVSWTCTRSTETTRCAVLSLRCTTRWRADIVPRVRTSSSSRLWSSNLAQLSVTRRDSSIRKIWSTPSSRPRREHQLFPTEASSLPRDQLSSEQTADESEHEIY